MLRHPAQSGCNPCGSVALGIWESVDGGNFEKALARYTLESVRYSLGKSC